MKPSLSLILLGSAIVVLAASGATPTPKPTPKASASPSDATKKTTADSSASPKLIPLELATSSEELPPPTAVQSPASNNPPPKPILYMIGSEPFTAGGKNWIRVRYDVQNKNEYPADMFAAAPALPPCGNNTNASRTWVDFFDQNGKWIYGFCALSKPADLGKIWFAYAEGTIPPSYVYIELNDRQTNTKYKSNLADTTL
jgi:hypothetical protein